MMAWACPGEDWPARTLVPRPADMASRLTVSRSGSRQAGASPAAWAARNWAATTSIDAACWGARMGAQPRAASSPMWWTRRALVLPGIPGGLPATITTVSPLAQRPMSSSAPSTCRTMSSL
jgi:hypothetical protein